MQYVSVTSNTGSIARRPNGVIVNALDAMGIDSLYDVICVSRAGRGR